jgi:hypothetical protein
MEIKTFSLYTKSIILSSNKYNKKNQATFQSTMIGKNHSKAKIKNINILNVC